MTAEEIIAALAAKIKSTGYSTELKLKYNGDGFNGKLKQGHEIVIVEEVDDLVEALKQLIGA